MMQSNERILNFAGKYIYIDESLIDRKLVIGRADTKK